MTTPLPFFLTPEAERYVRYALRPQSGLGLEAAMVRTLAYEARDRRGRVIMSFPWEFFHVGYFVAGDRPHALHVEMFGVSVSVLPQTLECLRGRTLILKKHVHRYAWLRRETMHFLVVAEQGQSSERGGAASLTSFR